MQNNPKIHAVVTQFVSDLQDIFLADLIQAVSGTALSKARVSEAKAPVASRKRGAKRAPKELEQLTNRLYAYVQKRPGQRIEQIGAGMGVSTRELNLPVKKLIAAKKIHTRGQKRATTYSTKG